MDDSRESIKYDEKNLKAYFRFTKSAHLLGKLDEAMEWCTKGLKVDQKNMALLGEAEKLVKDIKERNFSEAQKKKERDLEEAQRKKLDDAIKVSQADPFPLLLFHQLAWTTDD